MDKTSYRQIEGRNPVVEAINANTKIFKIYLEEGVKKEYLIPKPIW